MRYRSRAFRAEGPSRAEGRSRVRRGRYRVVGRTAPTNSSGEIDARRPASRVENLCHVRAHLTEGPGDVRAERLQDTECDERDERENERVFEERLALLATAHAYCREDP